MQSDYSYRPALASHARRRPLSRMAIFTFCLATRNSSGIFSEVPPRDALYASRLQRFILALSAAVGGDGARKRATRDVTSTETRYRYIRECSENAVATRPGKFVLRTSRLRSRDATMGRFVESLLLSAAGSLGDIKRKRNLHTDNVFFLFPFFFLANAPASLTTRHIAADLTSNTYGIYHRSI